MNQHSGIARAIAIEHLDKKKKWNYSVIVTAMFPLLNTGEAEKYSKSSVYYLGITTDNSSA